MEVQTRSQGGSEWSAFRRLFARYANRWQPWHHFNASFILSRVCLARLVVGMYVVLSLLCLKRQKLAFIETKLSIKFIILKTEVSPIHSHWKLQFSNPEKVPKSEDNDPPPYQKDGYGPEVTD